VQNPAQDPAPFSGNVQKYLKTKTKNPKD